MNNNLNNTNENSYLCLVAIYAIHVVVFHVFSPPEISMTNVSVAATATLEPQLQPMARWRTREIVKGQQENISSLSFRDVNGEVRDDRKKKKKIHSSNRRDTNERIIAGLKATLGQFPHQVSLRRKKNGVHFCGGNIINEEWIVTAAHCMYSNNKLILPSTIKIYAGGLLLNETSSSSLSKNVKTIIVHENFNLRTLKNDIALLKLRSKLILDNVTVAAKALRHETVADGTPCQVSGWGVTHNGITVLSNELLYVDVPIINRTLCQKLMANYSDIPQVMICAGYVEGGSDSCRGDSGGGLICDDVLTGLVSWGKECGLANFPGIYTNVNVFKNWIFETISTNSLNPADPAIRQYKILSPGAWGVFFGCLVFLFTYNTDHDNKPDTENA